MPAGPAGAPSADADDVGSPSHWTIVRQVLLASAGNFLEWYDFACFGMFAQELGWAFFPSSNATTALLSAFALFAGAFVVRPIGGVLFGHIGDRHGREQALQLSIVVMTGCTLTIGLLPTFETLGVTSTVLLVLCRLVQGLAAGGELPSALVYAVESAGPRHMGFFGALVQATGSGSLLASVVRAVLHATIGDDGIASWAGVCPSSWAQDSRLLSAAYVAACERRRHSCSPSVISPRRRRSRQQSARPSVLRWSRTFVATALQSSASCARARWAWSASTSSSCGLLPSCASEHNAPSALAASLLPARPPRSWPVC
eukprot:7139962-Prymnesium_polylepis.1